MSVLSTLARAKGAILAGWTALVLDIQKARETAKPDADDPVYAIDHPTVGRIQLAKLRKFNHRLTPDEMREEARRIALDYARQAHARLTGRDEPITWKQAKLLLDRLAKEERQHEQDVKRAESRSAEEIAPDADDEPWVAAKDATNAKQLIIART